MMIDDDADIDDELMIDEDYDDDDDDDDDDGHAELRCLEADTFEARLASKACAPPARGEPGGDMQTCCSAALTTATGLTLGC